MRIIYLLTIILCISAISLNSYAAPIVHFNLKEFLSSTCPGAKTSGCTASDNKMRFYQDPGYTTNKEWKSSATYSEYTTNYPLLTAGQPIQLNGEIFWKDNNVNNGLVIGFIRTDGNSQATTTVTLKCIKNLKVTSRYTNGDSNLPNTHWNLRFRAPSTPSPSSPGKYYLFILNARNISNSATFPTPWGNVNMQTICNKQNASENVQPSSLDNYEAIEFSYNVASNSLGLLVSPAVGADFDTNKVFTQRYIYVKEDQCTASTASNVNWPATNAGTTVNAVNSWCNPSNRKLLSTTTRTCKKDLVTGRATGWENVSGPGCLQPCSSSTTNSKFNASKNMYLPSIYEGESVTVHAGSAGKSFGEIPMISYTNTNGNRSIGTYIPCFHNSNTLYTDKSVTIGCSYHPSNTYGTFTYSSNAQCVNLDTAIRIDPELRDYRNYFYNTYNTILRNDSLDTLWNFGRYGYYEAYYDGANPLSRPDSSRPNDGDRVLFLIDQTSWGRRDVNLSNIEAYYRTANGGGLEIRGEATYNSNFPWDMRFRFAIMGMFSFIYESYFIHGVYGFNLFSFRGPAQDVAMLSVLQQDIDQKWYPTFRYHGPKTIYTYALPPEFYSSFSFNAISRNGTYPYPSNTPVYLSIADTALDQLSYDQDWENSKRFSDCKWGNGWGTSGGYEGGSSCSAAYFNGCRYCPIFYEKSPVKFMMTSFDYSGVGNDWKMYFHPHSGDRKYIHTSTSNINLNGLDYYSSLPYSSASIIIGSPLTVSVLHKAAIIRWSISDNRWGGDRLINQRSGNPFRNSYGWRDNEVMTGLSGGRSATNNFFLDRQRSLETYHQYHLRYEWSNAHGIKDSCPGYHYWAHWLSWPNFWKWGDPCWSGPDSLGWGRDWYNPNGY